MNKLYLVRHGENKANLTKEFSCRKIDYPLTEKGRLQAEQTAEFFRGRDIGIVYTSPLLRAIQTAQIIARASGAPVEIIESFREIDVGKLEDMPPTEENWRFHFEVIKDWLEGKGETSFPGGENYFSARDRMRAEIERILLPGIEHNVVISGHGGLFFTSISDICYNVRIDRLIEQENHNCSITEIEMGWRDGRFSGKLLRWADHSHLHGEAADLVSGFPELP